MRRSETITTAEYSYTILLQPEPEGGYSVTCPALPGLVTYGKSLQQARTMAAAAIQGHIEALWAKGRPIPESDAPFAALIERVILQTAL